MGKIKKFFRGKSIRKDFALYLLFYILLSLSAALFCSECCRFGQKMLREKYRAAYEDFLIGQDFFTEEDFYGGQGYHTDGAGKLYLDYYTGDITSVFEPFDGLIYNILEICGVLVYPASFIVCIGAVSVLFYKRKLQEPLELLGRAADNISDNSLDFEIFYDRQDELGKLCMSFEKMRRALRDNQMEMWRQIEERKRLNAAFAHDLRTPLTVLKGQSEILIKYTPEMSGEKIMETAGMMKRHIARLENYVNIMNDLQRLEDIEIQKRQTQMACLTEQMKSTGEAVCAKKTFLFQNGISESGSMNLDAEICMQVYENLLANAVRYAKSMVKASVFSEAACFCVVISDDGTGFSGKDLVEAAKPFYQAKKSADGGQFGMGLYICRTLCEKHGGYLKLENRGGAFVTAVFGE